MTSRMQRVVKKGTLKAHAFDRDDLDYWLGQSAEARISCVETLRRQYYGNAPRLQRVARVVRNPQR
jgi:hypothetical protein